MSYQMYIAKDILTDRQEIFILRPAMIGLKFMLRSVISFILSNLFVLTVPNNLAG